MISRREFLRGGAVAGLASTLPAGQVIAASESRPSVAFDAVCDTRYEEGDLFLRTVSDSAYRVHGLEIDPGSIMPVISAAVADRHPIAGLTTDAALLLAEQLATAEGYQLTYKGTHKHVSTNQVEHELLLDKEWYHNIQAPLADAGSTWPEIIAKLVPTLITDKAGVQTQKISSSGQRNLDSPGHLVSWILRPA